MCSKGVVVEKKTDEKSKLKIKLSLNYKSSHKIKKYLFDCLERPVNSDRWLCRLGDSKLLIRQLDFFLLFVLSCLDKKAAVTSPSVDV